MKRFIYFLSFSAFILLNSCKKENNDNNNLELISNKEYLITSKGYLKFSSQTALISFVHDLINPQKREIVMKEIRKLGFKSRGNGIYTTARDSNSIYNLIFDEQGLLQVDNIILKISDDENFLYTLKAEMSDPETFSKLLNEIYDGLKMNKINVNRSIDENFNLIDFCSENPFGKLEELYQSTEKRPMFGSEVHQYTITDPAFYNVFGQCTKCSYTWAYTSTYIFWIEFNSNPVFVSQSCVPSDQCVDNTIY